jgi:hypothetical protein
VAKNPFTIRIFVPDGDPDGVRVIDRMNWTGLGIAFPRDKWPAIRQRAEFSRAGLYILSGYKSADEHAGNMPYAQLIEENAFTPFIRKN